MAHDRPIKKPHNETPIAVLFPHVKSKSNSVPRHLRFADTQPQALVIQQYAISLLSAVDIAIARLLREDQLLMSTHTLLGHRPFWSQFYKDSPENKKEQFSASWA
jgi:hypothetical protein